MLEELEPQLHCTHVFVKVAIKYVYTIYTDASDLGLHCLSMSQKWDALKY